MNVGLMNYYSLISKIMNAVRYVHASHSPMDRFKICIKKARWNSTYIMLESALKIQKTFKRLSKKYSEYVMVNGGVPNNED